MKPFGGSRLQRDSRQRARAAFSGRLRETGYHAGNLTHHAAEIGNERISLR